MTSYDKWKHTKNGMISIIYGNQRKNSTRRSHIPPEYTMIELRKWATENNDFHNIFNVWKESNFNQDLKPSIDRIDDYKPYRFNNIMMSTWGENKRKGNRDRVNGINNKDSKSVIQQDKNGLYIKEHYSARSAGRLTSTSNSDIIQCCKNKKKSAGGFTWKYKE